MDTADNLAPQFVFDQLCSFAVPFFVTSLVGNLVEMSKKTSWTLKSNLKKKKLNSFEK